MRREVFVRTYSAVTAASILGGFVYGYAVHESFSEYLLAAWESVGFEVFVILNAFMWVLSMGCFLFSPFSESELRIMVSKMPLSSCFMSLQLFFILEPSTDDELILWSVWFLIKWFVTYINVLACVRADAATQVSAISGSRQLVVLLSTSCLLSAGFMFIGLYLFHAAPISFIFIILDDAAFCLLNSLRSVGRYFILRMSSGGLVDVDARLLLANKLASIPADLLSMVACYYVVEGTSTHALIKMYKIICIPFYIMRIQVAVRETTRPTRAVQVPLPTIIEFRSYKDPCAICYEPMCFGATERQLTSALASDALVAAALVAALPCSFSEPYLPEPPSSPTPIEPSSNSLVTATVPLSMTPRYLRCGHMFHAKCLNSWMKEKRECPLCKRFIKI
eukprot:TRINITY_DN37731_c0_g1_i1.p1 TRINITY_DN37731_c0_g1~~TRINITY_DN37731_c0_g1_i1.p1  ORF type:complete len:405 (+),score=61.48 TRINITY_DN37731_c0_g1_i1:37-1215(+)